MLVERMFGLCPAMQRWFVRRSNKFIADHLEAQQGELVAISIVPPALAVTPGQLNSFSMVNFQRRLKYILAKADVPIWNRHFW